MLVTGRGVDVRAKEREQNTPLSLTCVLSASAFQQLQSDGVLATEIGKAHLQSEPRFLMPFLWMCHQMRAHIGKPASHRQTPTWAWYRFDGNLIPMDMSAHPHSERPSVVVELLLPASRVMLSDYSDWQAVIGLSYCADDEKDADWFERQCKERGYSSRDAHRDDHLRSLIVKSWDRILRDPKGQYAPKPTSADSAIQATLWELRLADVVRVRARTA